MKALISTTEVVNNFDGTTGVRVAQVEQDENIFPVADTMFWESCDSNVVADIYYYDETTKTILVKPIEPKKASTDQPTTSGTQTL